MESSENVVPGSLEVHSPFRLTGRWLPAAALGFGVAIAAAGAYLILSHTPWGVGVTHDGLFYLSAAQNFAAGEGVSWIGSGGQLKPLVHFPPFYPVVLGLLVRFGTSPAEAARWLSAVLFGLSASLLGFAIHRGTRHLWLGLVAAVIWLTSPVLLSVHLAAMSEPLYLALALLGLVSMASYIVRPSRRALVLSAAAVGMAWLTRWVGASLVAAFAVALLTLRREPLRDRLRVTIMFLTIAVLPVALWLARNIALTGSPTNRTLGYHPPTLDTLRQLLDVLTRWVTTAHLSHWLEASVLAAGVVLMGAISIRQLTVGRAGRAYGATLSLIGLFSLVSYLLFLTASLTFFDASTRVDDRILSPVLPLGVLVILTSLGSLLPDDWRSLLAAPLVVAALWVTLPNAWARSGMLLTSMREEGLGFASRTWQQSATVEWIRGLPREAILYTNEPTALQYLASRAARGIPQRYDPVTLIPHTDYLEQLEGMRSELRQPGSALVIFSPGSWPDEAAPMRDLTAGLVVLASTPDAQIYVHPDSPEMPSPP